MSNICTKQDCITRWEEYITDLAGLLNDTQTRPLVGDVWTDTEREYLKAFSGLLSVALHMADFTLKDLKNKDERRPWQK